MDSNKPQLQDGEKKIEKYIVRMKKPLGRGAYAQVYLGKSIYTNEPVAVKVIDKKIFANHYNLKNIQSQIEIMKKVEHRNIVRLLDVYQTTNNMYIVTELCEDGDLMSVIKRKKRLSERQAARLIKDVLDGFKYLLSLGITHRDLKPANILMKNGRCKISDFGFAKNLQYGENTIMNSIVGTPLYMSPQILSKAHYTNKSDLWSVGLIFYEMLHGYTPWPANNQIQLINNIMSKPIVFDPSVSEKSREFIKGCLRINEEDRISWEEAFNFSPFKEDDLVSNKENTTTYTNFLEREQTHNRNRSISNNNYKRDKSPSSHVPFRDQSTITMNVVPSGATPSVYSPHLTVYEAGGSRTPKTKLDRLFQNMTPQRRRDTSALKNTNRLDLTSNRVELPARPETSHMGNGTRDLLRLLAK